MTVTAVNDAPTNAPVALPAASEDSAAITITPAQLLANAADVDGDALAITGLAASSGSLSANADGTWRFTPAADFTGTVSFTYSITDGTAAVAGSASLTATAVNDAPSTAPVALPAASEEPVSIGGPATVSFTPPDPSPTTLPPGTAASTTFAGPASAGETVASGEADLRDSSWVPKASQRSHPARGSTLPRRQSVCRLPGVSCSRSPVRVPAAWCSTPQVSN
ncbi:cadherin-like domain-containing protein [Polaromonas sp. P2-4]|nr:cadherin-like domain-containing protein [Polaromonas sp. P2-4]